MANCFDRHLFKAKTLQEMLSELAFPLYLLLPIDRGLLSAEPKGNLRILPNTKAVAHPTDIQMTESCFPTQMTPRPSPSPE